MGRLMDYEWPGNVRELENMIERSTVLSQGGVITEDHIIFSGAENRRFVDVAQQVRKGAKLSGILQDVEKLALTEALNQTDGDRVAAASLLGMPVGDFQSRIGEFGL